jgi:hypothetical protein
MQIAQNHIVATRVFNPEKNTGKKPGQILLQTGKFPGLGTGKNRETFYCSKVHIGPQS